MSGWLYIIKNGDLYKIGITKNIEQRMRQLRPDYIVSKLYSSNFKQLEREFHKRYKNVRSTKTEYFQLDNMHRRAIKIKINDLSYPKGIIFFIIKSFCLLMILFSYISTYIFIHNN